MAASTTVLTGNVGLAKLSVSTAQNSVYANILGLIDLDNPETTLEEYETTNTDIADNRKTFKNGWGESGEASFTFNFTEATWSQIKAIGDAEANWRTTWKDPEQLVTDPVDDFTGYIKTKKKNQPINDRWSIDITIKLNGDVAFSEGT